MNRTSLPSTASAKRTKSRPDFRLLNFRLSGLSSFVAVAAVAASLREASGATKITTHEVVEISAIFD